jgi:membrane associated rhomboid family serine protease
MTGGTMRSVRRDAGRAGSPGAAAALMTLLLALLWVLEAFDQLVGGRLDYYGIRAGNPDGLPEIFVAPFLHASWEHLVSNSGPFFVLGFLVLLGGMARWLASSLISMVSSGLTAWLLTPPGTIIIGASGLIFGWLTYLVARSIWSRRPGQLAISVLILIVYGGMIFGVLPSDAGVSWQAHLGGAVGGVVAAFLLHRRGQRPLSPMPRPGPRSARHGSR